MPHSWYDRGKANRPRQSSIEGGSCDFQKQQSSFTSGTSAKLTKLPQMSQMVKLQETANNLIKQYAKFELTYTK